jgi:putative iron-only hydrogenase system regulator
MDTRIAIIGIIIEDIDAVEDVNMILHDYGMYVIGRMGLPYRERNLNIISLAMDAPLDVINTLAGKLGKLSGVNVKTMYSKTKGGTEL